MEETNKDRAVTVSKGGGAQRRVQGRLPGGGAVQLRPESRQVSHKGMGKAVQGRGFDVQQPEEKGEQGMLWGAAEFWCVGVVPVQMGLAYEVRTVGRDQVRGRGVSCRSACSQETAFSAATLPAGMMCCVCWARPRELLRTGCLIFSVDKKSQLCPLLDQKVFCT